MIVCKELDKSFETKEQMFKALKTNKASIIAQKKMQTKHADTVSYTLGGPSKDGQWFGYKANNSSIDSSDTLSADLVINTTKIMDSHSDVHLDGIWNKSVKEQKNLYLLQEHKMSFSNIITDSVDASVKSIPWSNLGVNSEGSTEALVFSSEISKDRNPFMFDQYSKGFVKNHSVGMRYVNLDLALDSNTKEDSEEKNIWDDNIDSIVNKQDAIDQGYFWAVSEAKIIEGSAVPAGSNPITPVLSINNKGAGSTTPENEPPPGTQPNTTGKEPSSLSYHKFI